jgi:hypothetical protein
MTFKSFWGTFISAQPDGRVEGDRTEAREWEGFTSVPGERDGSVAFRTYWGTYLSALPDGTVDATATEVHDWQSWFDEPQPNGTHAYKSAHGKYLVVTDHKRVLADRGEAREWEQFTDAGGGGAVANPIAGVLKASYEHGTSDDNGHRLVVLCHAGDLLARAVHDKATVESSLDQIAAAGYQGVRTWTVLSGNYWQQRTGEVHPGTPGYWDLVRWFCEQLSRRQLRWLVSQGDLMSWTQDTRARRDFMRQLAETIRDAGNPSCGVDAGNETWQNGESDPRKLKDALDAFTAVLPLPVRTLTSPWREEEANDFLVDGVLRDIHSSRGPWPTPGRRVFNIGYEQHPHVYTVQSEGPGYGVQEYRGDNRPGHHVSATDRPAEWNDNDPEIGGTLAGLHAIGKALYVWFASPGVISDEPFTNYAAFTVVPKLYSMLPSDVQSWRTFHGGEGRAFSVDRVLAVPANDGWDVRCDHAASGDQRVCIAYGPQGQYGLRVVNNFEGIVINPGTLSTEQVSWRAGQIVGLAWRRGRILVGRVV